MQQGPSGPTSQALRGHAGQHSAGSFLPDATRSGSLALTNANRNASGEEPCNGPRGSGNVFVASALDTRLFTMYQQPPAPGFQKISQTQLVRADRHAFVRLNELRMGSLKPGGRCSVAVVASLATKFKPPELSVGALRSSAGKVRAAVRQSTRFFGDPGHGPDSVGQDPHRGRKRVAGGSHGMGDADRIRGRVEEVSPPGRAEGASYRRLLGELHQCHGDTVGETDCKKPSMSYAPRWLSSCGDLRQWGEAVNCCADLLIYLPRIGSCASPTRSLRPQISVVEALPAGRYALHIQVQCQCLHPLC